MMERTNSERIVGAVVVVAAVLLTCGCGASAQQAVPVQFMGQLQAKARTLEVTGQAMEKVVPDEFVIDASVTTLEQDLSTARAKNDLRVEAVFKGLRALGVDDRYLVTTDLRLQPRYTGSRHQGNLRLQGYEMRKELRVIVHDVRKLEPALVKMVDAGVDQIQRVEFGSRSIEEHQLAAELGAVENAKTRARKMADRLGVKLGEVMEVKREHRGAARGSFVYAKAVPSAGVALGIGKLRLSAQVRVVYALR